MKLTCRERREEHMIGIVKWFNTQKGYGFIAPEGGGKDIFVHVTEVQRAGLNTLNEGQRIRFDMQPGRDGKSTAGNLTVA
jgi:CspA family cold shock protein